MDKPRPKYWKYNQHENKWSTNIYSFFFFKWCCGFKKKELNKWESQAAVSENHLMSALLDKTFLKVNYYSTFYWNVEKMGFWENSPPGTTWKKSFFFQSMFLSYFQYFQGKLLRWVVIQFRNRVNYTFKFCNRTKIEFVLSPFTAGKCFWSNVKLRNNINKV